MLRPPPRPPLFPYTTLFRSRAARRHAPGLQLIRQLGRRQWRRTGPNSFTRTRSGQSRILSADRNPASRSEEHTSELQSHHDLVCRLLLEKKNNTTNSTTITY